MKDVIYALGAQLAYYNWHNYVDNKKNMYEILKEDMYIKTLTQGKDQNFIDNNKSEKKTLSNGKEVTIYKEEDKRLLMMYSEDRENANENPLFKELFEGWNFIEGMNHEKAFNETNIASVKKIIYRFGPKDREFTFSYAGLSEKPTPIKDIKDTKDTKDSGFQAFAMEKGNDILISYRGTDFKTEPLKDMVFTNIPIFFNSIPDQVLGAVYFYEKIKEKYPNKNIHITGHSLGGGLAQFVALYGGSDIKKTVTWNGLGIRNVYKEMENPNNQLDLVKRVGAFILLGALSPLVIFSDFYKKSQEIKKIKNMQWLKKVENVTAELNMNNKRDSSQNPYKDFMKFEIITRVNSNYETIGDKLINYYLSGDIVKKLSTKTGRSICVDDFLQSSNAGGVVKTLTTGLNGGNMSWHGINNFLPFISDKGEVIANKLRRNYVSNAIKTLVLNKGKDVLNGVILDNYDELYKQLELNEKIFLLGKNITQNFKNNKKEENYYLRHYLKDDYLKDNIHYVYILGEFNNFNLLCGVVGEDEEKINPITISIEE